MELATRIPEPELMDDRDQVQAYASADFEEPHSRVLDLFRETFPEDLEGSVLDLGCGPGDISFRFARAFPRVRVVGVDGSPEMLQKARELRGEDLRDRVHFVEGYLPSAPIPPGPWSAIVSNSLLHHLHDPSGLWATVRSQASPGTRVFLVDLMRPASTEEAQAFVERYSGGEPEVLKRDFYNSLLAAFRPDEVEAQLREAGLPQLAVRPVSDRHLLVWGRY